MNNVHLNEDRAEEIVQGKQTNPVRYSLFFNGEDQQIFKPADFGIRTPDFENYILVLHKDGQVKDGITVKDIKAFAQDAVQTNPVFKGRKLDSLIHMVREGNESRIVADKRFLPYAIISIREEQKAKAAEEEKFNGLIQNVPEPDRKAVEWFAEKSSADTNGYRKPSFFVEKYLNIENESPTNASYYKDNLVKLAYKKHLEGGVEFG